SLQAKKNSCTRKTNPSVKKLLIIFGYSLILKARRWCKRFGFLPQQTSWTGGLPKALVKKIAGVRRSSFTGDQTWHPALTVLEKVEFGPDALLEGRENPTERGFLENSGRPPAASDP